MRKVDLARWRFDFDLTVAAILAEADGFVWHRYGGRSTGDPQSALSLQSLAMAMRGTLAERAERKALPRPMEDLRPRTIEDLPLFQRRDAEERADCVHCHMIHDFEYHEALAAGSFRREQIFIYPDPLRVGLEIDRDDQQKIESVTPDSPSARAGLEPDDRLVGANGQAVLTRADLQWVLHHLPFTECKLSVEIERDGAKLTKVLALAEGWRVASALEYAWRPYKWNLPPQPGFGGGTLKEDRKKALGLQRGDFAVEIGYIVNWGDHSRFGRNAEKAGLRKGDVLLSAGGRSDFASEEHFQAWFRLEQTIGKSCELIVLRDGKRQTLQLPVIE